MQHCTHPPCDDEARHEAILKLTLWPLGHQQNSSSTTTSPLSMQQACESSNLAVVSLSIGLPNTSATTASTGATPSQYWTSYAAEGIRRLLLLGMACSHPVEERGRRPRCMRMLLQVIFITAFPYSQILLGPQDFIQKQDCLALILSLESIVLTENLRSLTYNGNFRNHSANNMPWELGRGNLVSAWKLKGQSCVPSGLFVLNNCELKMSPFSYFDRLGLLLLLESVAISSFFIHPTLMKNPVKYLRALRSFSAYCSRSGIAVVAQEVVDGAEVSNGDEQDFGEEDISDSNVEAHTVRKKKDLLMVYLLRLVCSRGSLVNALPEISSELHGLGILSEWGRLLATKPPETFAEAFRHCFSQHMIGSQIPQFWKGDLELSSDGASSHANSRYLSDFEEINSLGHGGFGHVVLCKNKLDGRLYAVKMIRLQDKSPHVNDKILRTRKAWYEAGLHHEDRTTENSDCSSNDNMESTYLYIQMEYCQRTLRQDFDAYSGALHMDYIWRLFRQIVEGLAHIHGRGIIHRDLTPNNIFLDGLNDIKIGDFGLAKFLKLEELDHDQHSLDETSGVSVGGTSEVGTYFYTAPEIEQRWPQINEKVDIYSLGVVFFELWHPFATAMERQIILSDLKQKGLPPPSWVDQFPDQAALLQQLVSPSPSDRPSASELLQNALPPRIEDIHLTIQTSEDTHVSDRVASTIFDEEKLIIIGHHQNVSSGKMSRDESSSGPCNEYDTELHGAKRLESSPISLFSCCPPFDKLHLIVIGSIIVFFVFCAVAYSFL
ncbi:hypothetical protein J5N97_012773 [Dioscorea zingiberensis]|uniref:Protein kinase domain-containing protein n=1 Tax=Dioscorea zingiberensis TaxID=325984 RepID=A0A9D5HI41_9LILI|nr:hypothetical protein J5N97_012773 [Dioscorea zingiberensis]